jgi:hypothetical protein
MLARISEQTLTNVYQYLCQIRSCEIVIVRDDHMHFSPRIEMATGRYSVFPVIREWYGVCPATLLVCMLYALKWKWSIETLGWEGLTWQNYLRSTKIRSYPPWMPGRLNVVPSNDTYQNLTSIFTAYHSQREISPIVWLYVLARHHHDSVALSFAHDDIKKPFTVHHKSLYALVKLLLCVLFTHIPRYS